jgi:hypothetical protein
VALEIPHLALVFFGGGTGLERAQIAPFAGDGVLLARIQAEFA